MRIVGIIPARLASTRFPGKPLAPILGMPMIGHVFYRARMSQRLEQVYVATCDRQIAEYADSIGAPRIMTAPAHERASDRTAEALLEIEHRTGVRFDIVVMIQGDEPMVMPDMIDQAVTALIEDPSIPVSNLMSELRSRDEQEDVNEVKVVVDQQQFALYFSREPIPSWKKGAKSLPMYKQVCVMAFQRDYLLQFNALSPTPLEIGESVDMLRVLEHGGKVKMVETKHLSYSVDTEEDRQHVEALMEHDPLVPLYRQWTSTGIVR